MESNQIQNLVFSSSCTVYGQPDKLPVTESSPIKEAYSPYGNTKQISEEIICDTANVRPELQAISLRYFNPIGAHPSSEIGELPLGIPDNLVPYITQTAIGVRDYLRVFGDDYNTPDGSCIRDYLHVVDLARAHVVAIERLLEEKNKTNYEVFNLGTGHGVSVFEMINSFEKVAGVKLKHKIVERRPGDIEQVWADTSHANEILEWRAEYSIDEALLSAWNWEKKLRGK
jgi:UDP-glucose 4-epimerase